MKIKKSQLRRIILNELFEKDAAVYNLTLSSDGAKSPEYVKYSFSTDDDLKYEVKISALTRNRRDRTPVGWSVNFWNLSQGTWAGVREYELTNKFDLKVLNTIIQAVKTFITDVRPDLPEPYASVNKFTSYVEEEDDYVRRLNNYDTRRARIYQYMLKKKGIPSEIAASDDGVAITFTL